MSPELELMDQLLGCDEPLTTCLNIFPSAVTAQWAVHKCLRDGHIEVLDAEHSAVPLWKWDSWCRSESEWNSVVATLTLRLKDKGVKHIG